MNHKLFAVPVDPRRVIGPPQIRSLCPWHLRDPRTPQRRGSTDHKRASGCATQQAQTPLGAPYGPISLGPARSSTRTRWRHGARKGRSATETPSSATHPAPTPRPGTGPRARHHRLRSRRTQPPDAHGRAQVRTAYLM
uniref:Uncharacterized protein n=1 Tax=Knipowitschia caucasica TaxID=637954 RepID=A0AAV2KYK9_KNICA